MKDQTRYNLWTQFLQDYKEYLSNSFEVWFQQFEEIKSFINIHKRKPSITSKNTDESMLGNWLSTQQSNYKNRVYNMKDDTRYNVWSQFLEEYKEYLLTSEEIWYKNFEELKIFIDNNKRKPSISIPEEKQLYLWLSTQKSNYKENVHSMKDITRYNLWSHFLEKYKEYILTEDEIWLKTFEELKTFININKRTPSSKSSIQEKQLGKWLSHQQQNYKKKTQGLKNETRYNLWTQFLENYKEYFVSDKEVWFQNFEELKMFININKRKPLVSIKNSEETQLGRWVCSQQKNYKTKTDGMKNESRYNLWTQFLEEYKEHFVSTDEIWYQMFEELKMFIDVNKQKPLTTSKNIVEKQLSQWISTQQQNYKTKTDGMKNESRYNLWSQFLEDYNEYFVSTEEIWFQSFEELKLFIVTNKRRPTAMSKNPEEAQIGRWVQFNQINYKKKTKGMKDESRYNLWTQFLEDYKEYVISDEELWFQNFEECKIFITMNKTRPLPISKNPKEKPIGSWLHHQQHNYKYKTGGMKTKHDTTYGLNS